MDGWSALLRHGCVVHWRLDHSVSIEENRLLTKRTNTCVTQQGPLISDDAWELLFRARKRKCCGVPFILTCTDFGAYHPLQNRVLREMLGSILVAAVGQCGLLGFNLAELE